MTELTTARAPVNAEAVPLADEMGRAVGELVAALEEHWNLTRDEALARIHEDDPETVDRRRAKAPDHLSFVDLYTLGRHSGELAARRWAEVMQAARNELKSGHRAASIVTPPGVSSRCWSKARLLAMRAELLEGWQPRNSVERLLVDTLMQVQSQYEHWLEVLTGARRCRRFTRACKKHLGYRRA